MLIHVTTRFSLQFVNKMSNLPAPSTMKTCHYLIWIQINTNQPELTALRFIVKLSNVVKEMERCMIKRVVNRTRRKLYKNKWKEINRRDNVECDATPQILQSKSTPHCDTQPKHSCSKYTRRWVEKKITPAINLESCVLNRDWELVLMSVSLLWIPYWFWSGTFVRLKNLLFLLIKHLVWEFFRSCCRSTLLLFLQFQFDYFFYITSNLI